MLSTTHSLEWGLPPACLDTASTGLLQACSLSLSLCYFLFLLPSYSAPLWPTVTHRDSFKELCDRLAFLDLILSPSGQTFLLLSSQNSVLYFRDLLQHLWGLRKLDLCLQLATLFATRADSPVVFAQAPTDWELAPFNWLWQKHLSPGCSPLGMGFCFLRHCLSCLSPQAWFNSSEARVMWPRNIIVMEINDKEKSLFPLNRSD